MTLVLFTGSRDWEDWLTINRVFKQLRDTLGPFTAMQGGARGVDTYIKATAPLWGMSVYTIPPRYDRWSRYEAPKRRNISMLEEGPDLVVGFWNGTSIGTLHCLNFAVNVYRIPTLIYLENK